MAKLETTTTCSFGAESLVVFVVVVVTVVDVVTVVTAIVDVGMGWLHTVVDIPPVVEFTPLLIVLLMLVGVFELDVI